MSSASLTVTPGAKAPCSRSSSKCRPIGRARTVASYLPVDDNDDRVWWGGPTKERFALIELRADSVHEYGRLLEARSDRPFVTARTAVFFPFRDHPPGPHHVARVRIFLELIWLDSAQSSLYGEEGTVRPAADDDIFDGDHGTLAERLRARVSP